MLSESWLHSKINVNEILCQPGMRVEIRCYVQRRALVLAMLQVSGLLSKNHLKPDIPPLLPHSKEYVRRDLPPPVLTLLVAVFNVSHSHIDATFECIDLELIVGRPCTYILAPFSIF